MAVLYSIIESPQHPNLADLYVRYQHREIKFPSVRKAIQALKTTPPDIVVADFIYGYGNNYAGVNISNLDVFLYSLQKYAPHAKVVVFYDKTEKEFVAKLQTLFEIDSCLQYPVQAAEMERLVS